LFLKKFGGTEGLLKRLKSIHVEEDGKTSYQLKTTEEELQERKDIYGLNIIEEIQSRSVFWRVMYKCWDIELRLLIFGAIATLFVGNTGSKKDGAGDKSGSEAFTIIMTLLLICLIDSITSKVAEEDIKSSRETLNIQMVEVQRNNEIKSMKSNEIVVGDVFLIKPGTMIPADSILIENEGMVVCNEQDVTGYADYKTKGLVTMDTIKDDLNFTNVLYAKSYVISGKGKAVVCAVGHKSQIGIV